MYITVVSGLENLGTLHLKDSIDTNEYDEAQKIIKYTSSPEYRKKVIKNLNEIGLQAEWIVIEEVIDLCP
jgi:DNA repair photolyase